MAQEIAPLVVYECFIVLVIFLAVWRNRQFAERLATSRGLGPEWVLPFRIFVLFFVSLWITGALLGLVEIYQALAG
ncbi:MAG: hypothetical protein KKA32_14835 [Actinobacteria bacterium]|nr:hypothetical protein [Actinomycetota bacterium]